MRGARCKALRADFEKRFGRVPNRSQTTTGIFKNRIVGGTIPSEWRRLKKSYQEARRG